MDGLTKGLGPFDVEQQTLLIQVDNACSQQMQELQDKMKKASLAGDVEYEISYEDLIWTKIIRAYGLLMNQAIAQGWVGGIMTEDK